MKKRNNNKPQRTQSSQSNISDNSSYLRGEKYTLTEASLKQLAFLGHNIAQIEQMLSEELRVKSEKLRKIKSDKSKTNNCQLSNINLNTVFEKRPELKTAFDRGRFLRNIAEFGGKNYTVAEAGGELGLKAGELDKVFATDFEAADIWNQARLQTLLAIKNKWLDMVGMASPAALKQLEKLMSRGIIQPAADLTHITSKQMQELTDKSRQTIENDWPKKYGLPRNTDGTFNLFVFFAWYTGYVKSVNTGPAKSDKNSLADIKARRLEVQMQRETGDLLERNKVIAGLTARHQTLLRIFSRALTDQKDPFVKQTLDRIFEDVRRELAAVPPELRLSEPHSGKLQELLNELSDTEDTEVNKSENAHHEEKEDKNNV